MRETCDTNGCAKLVGFLLVTAVVALVMCGCASDCTYMTPEGITFEQRYRLASGAMMLDAEARKVWGMRLALQALRATSEDIQLTDSERDARAVQRVVLDYDEILWKLRHLAMDEYERAAKEYVLLTSGGPNPGPRKERTASE